MRQTKTRGLNAKWCNEIKTSDITHCVCVLFKTHVQVPVSTDEGMDAVSPGVSEEYRTGR